MKSKISKITEFFKTLWFAITLNWLYTFLFLAFAGVSYWIAKHQADLFTKYIDPIAGIMTLIVAIGIALVNYRRQWKDGLHKTLSIHFLYQGKYVLSCYYADLVSEGDIRNWAQQIGQQMTGAFLDFEPFFDLDKPEVITLESNGDHVMHYNLKIFLKSDKNLRSPNELAFVKGDLIRWYICHSLDHKQDEKVDLIKVPSREMEPLVDFATDVLPFRKK